MFPAEGVGEGVCGDSLLGAGTGRPSTEGGFFVVALIRAVLLEGGTGWDRTIPLEDSAVRD